jgi:hypothetical protein
LLCQKASNKIKKQSKNLSLGGLMAQFLNHDDLSFHFDRLIKQADEKLILITPVLKFNR